MKSRCKLIMDMGDDGQVWKPKLKCKLRHGSLQSMLDNLFALSVAL